MTCCALSQSSLRGQRPRKHRDHGGQWCRLCQISMTGSNFFVPHHTALERL